MTAHRRKTCRTCKVEKPIGKFYQHPTYADGYMNDCKACKLEYQAANDALKVEHIRERQDANRCGDPLQKRLMLFPGLTVATKLRDRCYIGKLL